MEATAGQLTQMDSICQPKAALFGRLLRHRQVLRHLGYQCFRLAPQQQHPAQQPAQPAPSGQPTKKDEPGKDRFTLIELE